MEIISWMGDHYGDKIKAWWFDSPYSLDPEARTTASRPT